MIISESAYSQEIINSLKKQAFDVADKELVKLINKVSGKDTPEQKTTSLDTTAKVSIEKWDCPSCGTKDNSGKFCKECGTKRPEPVTPWKCPKCGNEGNEGKFCTNCGEKKPEEWTCPDCGKHNTGNFCTECGAKKPGAGGKEATGAQSKDYKKYIQDLTPAGPADWKMQLNIYDNPTPSSTLDFSNFQDAISNIVQLPSAKWMVTPDSSAAWKLQQQNVEAALSIMTVKYSNSIIELQNAPKKEKENVIPKLKISQEDKDSAVKAAGIDIGNVTEEHIYAALCPYLSNKWGIDEKDAEKIVKMSRTDESIAVDYIKEKYPNKLTIATNIELKEDKYKAIADSLRQLSNDIESSSHTTLEQDLKVLVEEISSSWQSSEEAQNVIELESALDNLMSKYNSNSTMGNEQTPSSWAEARKAENTIIQAWNMQQAIKWRKTVQEHLSIYKSYATRLASYENELERIRNGEQYDEEYIKTRTLCSSMISIVVKYVTLPAAVLNIPLAKYVSETK